MLTNFCYIRSTSPCIFAPQSSQSEENRGFSSPCERWGAKLQGHVLRISQKCVKLHDFCNCRGTCPCIFAPQISHSEENQGFSSTCERWATKTQGDVLRKLQNTLKCMIFTEITKSGESRRVTRVTRVTRDE